MVSICEGLKNSAFSQNKGSSFKLPLFLLIPIVFLIPFSSFAQGITITSEDMPVPGLVAYMSESDTLNPSSLEIKGENLDWDFSYLRCDTQRVDSFIALADVSTAYAFIFSDATVIQYLASGDSILDFEVTEAFQMYKNTPAGFEDIGLGAELTLFPFPLGLRRDPVDVIYPFPLVYGLRDTSFSRIEFEITILRLFYESEQTRFTEVDGWGKLKTPYGEFESLRVNSRVVRSDSVSIGDTTNARVNFPELKEFKWLAKGEGVPVLRVSMVENTDTIFQAVSEVVFKDNKKNLNTPRKGSISTASLPLYPNPSQGKVNLPWNKMGISGGTLEIYELSGKRLMSFSIKGKESIDLRILPKGVYFVQLIHHGAHFSGKLQIE